MEKIIRYFYIRPQLIVSAFLQQNKTIPMNCQNVIDNQMFEFYLNLLIGGKYR